MTDERYFGDYVTFYATSKGDGAQLLSANCIVGDTFSIEFDNTEEKTIVWLVNKFNRRIGYIEDSTARRLSILHARNFTLRAYLSFIAFSEKSDEGYWGQVAVICNNPIYDEAFDNFAAFVAKQISQDMRPVIDMSKSGVDQVISSNGSWHPSGFTKLPEKERGTVIMKHTRSNSDKLVEAARTNNKGCVVGAWIFFIALIVGLVFLLKSCIGI